MVKKKQIEVSIVIVAYKAKMSLEKCLASIPRNSNYEVIVIDNNKKNLGFAKACNMGAKKANGKYILFLNPDTEIQGNAIEILKKRLKENSDIGIVGPQLVDEKDKPYLNYSLQPTYKSAYVVYSFINRLLPKIKVVKEHWMKDIPPNKDIGVGVISGAALMLRHEDFEALGGFDKRFFMYWEEVDLCRLMIEKLNKQVVFVPKAKIKHIGGASGDKRSFEQRHWFYKSRFVFFRKYYGWWKAELMDTWFRTTEEWKLGVVLIMASYSRFYDMPDALLVTKNSSTALFASINDSFGGVIEAMSWYVLQSGTWWGVWLIPIYSWLIPGWINHSMGVALILGLGFVLMIGLFYRVMDRMFGQWVAFMVSMWIIVSPMTLWLSKSATFGILTTLVLVIGIYLWTTNNNFLKQTLLLGLSIVLVVMEPLMLIMIPLYGIWWFGSGSRPIKWRAVEVVGLVLICGLVIRFPQFRIWFGFESVYLSEFILRIWSIGLVIVSLLMAKVLKHNFAWGRGIWIGLIGLSILVYLFDVVDLSANKLVFYKTIEDNSERMINKVADGNKIPEFRYHGAEGSLSIYRYYMLANVREVTSSDSVVYYFADNFIPLFPELQLRVYRIDELLFTQVKK